MLQKHQSLFLNSATRANDLKISAANSIADDTRLLCFYVELPNYNENINDKAVKMLQPLKNLFYYELIIVRISDFNCEMFVLSSVFDTFIHTSRTYNHVGGMLNEFKIP